MKKNQKSNQEKLNGFIHRLNVQNTLLFNAGSAAESLINLINRRLEQRRSILGRIVPQREQMLAKLA